MTEAQVSIAWGTKSHITVVRQKAQYISKYCEFTTWWEMVNIFSMRQIGETKKIRQFSEERHLEKTQELTLKGKHISS